MGFSKTNPYSRRLQAGWPFVRHAHSNYPQLLDALLAPITKILLQISPMHHVSFLWSIHYLRIELPKIAQLGSSIEAVHCFGVCAGMMTLESKNKVGCEHVRNRYRWQSIGQGLEERFCIIKYCVNISRRVSDHSGPRTWHTNGW